jgi:hypothetical protein
MEIGWTDVYILEKQEVTQANSDTEKQEVTQAKM